MVKVTDCCRRAQDEVHMLPMFPLEFRGEVNQGKTRVMGLFSSEDCMIVA